MNIELITKVVIPIIGILFTYFAIPLIREITTKQERDNIYFIVKQLVYSAEQIYNYQHSGRDKKDFVIGMAKRYNINITDKELDMLIEAVVLELNMAKKTYQ